MKKILYITSPVFYHQFLKDEFMYRISVAERGLTGITNIFRRRLSGLGDLLQAGTFKPRFVPFRRIKDAGLFGKTAAASLDINGMPSPRVISARDLLQQDPALWRSVVFTDDNAFCFTRSGRPIGKW